MALDAGSVTISGAGTPSGTGLSRELYDVLAGLFGLGSVTPPSAPGAQQQIADIANAVATAVVAHVVANAEVEVTVASGIAVSTTGSATAQTGVTTSTGTGSGTVS